MSKPDLPKNKALLLLGLLLLAIVSGIVTGEWKLASAKAKNLLYTGLACMVVGILIISVGNKFASDIPSQEPVAATSPAELPSN